MDMLLADEQRDLPVHERLFMESIEKANRQNHNLAKAIALDLEMNYQPEINDKSRAIKRDQNIGDHLLSKKMLYESKRELAVKKNESKELYDITFQPSINQHSKKLVENNVLYKETIATRSQEFQQKASEKVNALKNVIQENELSEVRSKPSINNQSKHMKRDVDDLMRFKAIKEAKLNIQRQINKSKQKCSFKPTINKYKTNRNHDGNVVDRLYYNDKTVISKENQSRLMNSTISSTSSTSIKRIIRPNAVQNRLYKLAKEQQLKKQEHSKREFELKLPTFKPVINKKSQKIVSRRKKQLEEESKPAWTEYLTPDGYRYYYNRITKQTSWSKPSDYTPTSEIPAKDETLPIEHLLNDLDIQPVTQSRSSQENSTESPEPCSAIEGLLHSLDSSNIASDSPIVVDDDELLRRSGIEFTKQSQLLNAYEGLYIE